MLAKTSSNNSVDCNKDTRSLACRPSPEDILCRRKVILILILFNWGPSSQHLDFSEGFAMPRVVEFRIPFPSTTDEYKMGQIYMVAKLCSEMTDPKDGAGVESITNEPCKLPGYGDGMYTKKYYHFRSRLPGYVRAVCPKSATFMVEEAWNCFPYARTVINHPSFTKFNIEIVTLHLPAKRDAGGKILYDENVHKLSPEELKKRKVRVIDIGDKGDLKPEQWNKDCDPEIFKSHKAERGPLTMGWIQREKEMMVAYKLVTITCNYFGIAKTVEDYLENYEYGLFKNSHRKFFCWMDAWYGLTDQEIREYEAQVNKEMTERMRAAKGNTGVGPVGVEEVEQQLRMAKLDDMQSSSGNLIEAAEQQRGSPAR